MYVPQMIYIRGSGDVRTDLLGALHSQGYSPQVFTAIDDVVQLCGFGTPGLIVVDASAGEAEASQRFVELSSATALKAVPIVFISRGASKRSAVLKKQFQTFIAVDVPFRMNSLLEALQKICPPEKAKEAQPPGIVLNEAPPVAVEEKPTPRVVVAPVESAPAKIPKADPTNLVASYGGELLANGSDISRFDDALLVPDHPAQAQILALLKSFTDSDAWFGAHVRRTTFVASAVANSLHLGTQRDAQIRAAGLLMNWGFGGKKALLLHDVFLSSEERVLVDLADAYELSAHQVRERIKDDLVARLIFAIANTLRSQPLAEEPNVIFDAHCALATELIDRACWASGAWNPYGAHRSLRKLWCGEPFTFDRLIASSLSRIVVEAASARQRETVSDADDAPDRRLIEDALREAEHLFSGREHISLQVADLKPGMRLSMPLLSRDGRLLLRANTFLDQEMISRIWRLASIRAIKPPVHVLGQFGR